MKGRLGYWKFFNESANLEKIKETVLIFRNFVENFSASLVKP